RWLHRYNEGRLARLTGVKNHADEYTLSLRLQLKENIWSMRKIVLGVYVLVAALAVNAVICFAPILCLRAPEQFETLQWMTCIGNVVFAIISTKAHVIKKDIDNYFNQLDSQWSTGL
ncbi:hypothetical protein PENTCL1PPCAC_3748, partial [Pristionchus entomophagus]